MARILVIEDEPHVQEVVKQFLELAGHQVAVASNGQEGIRACRERPFDLIVTDLIMPVKDGIETILDLKTEFPEIKAIAISGGGLVGPETYLELAESFGANRLLKKPFKKEDLLEAVNDVLGSE